MNGPENVFPTRLLSLPGDGAREAGATEIDPRRINQHIEGIPSGTRVMTGEEVARLLNDPFATLVLRRGKFPSDLGELLDALDEHNPQPDGLPQQSSSLVSEGGQIRFSGGVDKGGTRLITVRSRRDSPELIISTLVPAGISTPGDDRGRQGKAPGMKPRVSGSHSFAIAPRPAARLSFGKEGTMDLAVTISPATNDLTLSKDDALAETVKVAIPASGAGANVDVYFLADTTGSMNKALAAVKSGLSTILAAVGGLGADVQFGVGDYKDFPAPATGGQPHAFKHQCSLTPNHDDIKMEIDAWQTTPGRDTPEAQLYALDQLAESPGGQIGWRADSKRIIVWFGDAAG
ncbi:MAG: hypothetical protein ACRDJG_04755, partial [Actinomycetota bacterium]